MQITSAPSLIGVIAVNKQNYTHDMILKSKKFNVSALTTDAPFEVFKHFGFQSGKDVNKFADCSNAERSENGIIFLPKYSTWQYNPVTGLYLKYSSANDENLPTIGFETPASIHSNPNLGENNTFNAASLN